MKILHVESGKHFYGGARQVAYIIEGLASLGMQNILACPTGADIVRYVSEYAEVCETTMKGDVDVRMTSRLVKIIRKHRPDVIHLHSRRGADIWGGLAARITGTPCILSRRVDNPESRWLVSLKYRLYDHVITISEAIRQILIAEGIEEQKITCVRSAVDPSPYLHVVDRHRMSKEFRLPENAIVIGIVAQLIPRKGHQYLIDAVEVLSKVYPLLRVICFGQGPLLNQLTETVRKKKLDSIIQFTGFRSDLPEWLGGLDILAHPADMEGLGVSLLQASAACVPIVTTQAGGLPEVVLDDVTGILIKPGDITALIEALRRLIENQKMRQKFGAAGRARIISDFSVDAMAKGNLDVYRKVLNRTGLPPVY